jgi:hypothetical protein
LLTEEDYTLTKEEIKCLRKFGYKMSEFGWCHEYHNAISNIIGRSVFRCGTCYDCVGDDPIFDHYDIYVNTTTGQMDYRIPTDKKRKKEFDDCVKHCIEWNRKHGKIRG